MKLRRATAAVASLLTVVAVGCGNNEGNSSGSSASESTGNRVSITEQDFGITESTAQAQSGQITFAIHNAGPSVHEFVVIKTDLNDAELPLVQDGSEVDEDQLDGIGEREDIQPNSDATLSLKLDPGSYVFICNIKDHYSKGMHSSFTVS